MRRSESVEVGVDRQEPFSWVPYPNFGGRRRPCRGSRGSFQCQCHSQRDILLSFIDLLPHVLAHAAMACIPLAFPPSAVTPKLESEATPAPSRAPAWKLPNLGSHPTSRPSKTGVQKKRQQFNLPHRPKGSLAQLSAEEQIAQLRQSRKAIKSKLYSRIARLQVGAARLMPLDTPMLICSKAGV